MEITKIGHGQYTVKVPGETFSIQDGDAHTQPLLDMLLSEDKPAKEAFENNAKSIGIAKAMRQFCNLPEPPPRKTEQEIADAKAKEFAALMASGKYEEAFYVNNGLEKPKEDEVITPKG